MASGFVGGLGLLWLADEVAETMPRRQSPTGPNPQSRCPSVALSPQIVALSPQIAARLAYLSGRAHRAIIAVGHAARMRPIHARCGMACQVHVRLSC